MGIRSNAMLAQDFPVDTVAHLNASVRKFDFLTSDGFLGDFNDYLSIAAWIGAALDAKAETFAAPAAAYTGTAGAVDRHYGVVASYPLAFGPGAASAPAGRYLNFLGGKPPYGFSQSSAVMDVAHTQDGVRRLYGLPSPLTDVPAGAATLDASNYVTVTTPAAKTIPGVLFDIVESDNAGNFFLVAPNIAPGVAYKDQGTAGKVNLYGAVYAPRRHAEIAYDTVSNSIVYGSLQR